ncbi:PilX N-terminal domain-containing pilus assembly protein [Neisseria sp.]|uniref:pilus assembly PilX family protein n=1 Tax=Neisseria sp. TaxID=192066 RepID=UPI00289F5454|nr:PilX N-terminal domain-containing pilus assembly protein [Neisseria sp.]
MRRPQHQSITTPLPNGQGGFSLFIVLIVMIIIAFLAVAATQTYNTELRISSNDADRKMAMATAEAALRQGESAIASFTNQTFTADCTDGLCSQARQTNTTVDTNDGTLTIEGGSNDNAWTRLCGNTSCLETNGLTYTSAGAAKNARYIIEYMDNTTDLNGNTLLFRVTARAWGQNANTVVTVQSYVESIR